MNNINNANMSDLADNWDQKPSDNCQLHHLFQQKPFQHQDISYQISYQSIDTPPSLYILGRYRINSGLLEVLYYLKPQMNLIITTAGTRRLPYRPRGEDAYKAIHHERYLLHRNLGRCSRYCIPVIHY